MRTKNLINGQKPEFGNLKHIKFVQRIERIFLGEESFHSIEWSYCHYWGSHTETGKAKFKYVEFSEANALVDYIPCPKCSRVHVLLIPFDPMGNWYDELIQVNSIAENGFECWNCGLEMYSDPFRNLFVKVDKIDFKPLF